MSEKKRLPLEKKEIKQNKLKCALLKENKSKETIKATTHAHRQDIFLFVAVWDGRDRKNLPSGYKPVFFGWMGWMGWDGMEVRVRIVR